MAWVYLLIAVASNIASNFSFKMAMAAFPAEIEFHALIRFALNPYLWFGALCCVTLLITYLLALREIELLVSYAFVISLSLVGITLLSPVLLNEPLKLASIVGAGLVIAGIGVLTLSSKTVSG